jgi:hypothetical protein
MPIQPRLDAPGTLHHVIGRGILEALMNLRLEDNGLFAIRSGNNQGLKRTLSTDILGFIFEYLGNVIQSVSL